MDNPFDFNIHEALAILEDNVDIEPLEIFIEPPEPAVYSDEDSGDEDTGAAVNNLSGRQLSAPCEVVLAKGSRPLRNLSPSERESPGPSSIGRGVGISRRRTRITSRSRGRERGRGNASNARAKSSSNDDDSDITDTDEPAQKKMKSTRTWVKEDFSVQVPPFPEMDYSRYRDKSPVEMFELFWGEEVIQLLVDQSTKYAAFLNCPNPNITHDEMKAFIAFISFYSKPTSRRRTTQI